MLVLLPLLLLSTPALGFIGMSIPMYKPPCAYACRDMISSAMLECPDDQDGDHDMDDMGGMAMKRSVSLAKRHGHDDMASPECRAGSVPFLTTLAFCISQKCQGELESKIDYFWENKAADGDTWNPILPKWTYAESLMMVNSTPTMVYDSEKVLNGTVLVDDQSWREDYLTIDNFASGEAVHARYAVALLVIGVAIPILTTLLTFLFPVLIIKIRPYISYPALLGYNSQTPILRWLHFPTLGQTTYIVIFVILNILFTCFDYYSVQPNTWYPTRTQEIFSKVAARTGVIAMALAPLTFLFAGRNNILLYLTNWDHSTYILLHRWIARVFTLHVVIHSIGELWVYVDNGSYASNLPQAYWVWGCVATVACVAMCIKSVFRVWKYELFLILHIILAVFVLAGTWYHLIYRFDYRWGYHYMLYACFAIWAFDRVVRGVLVFRNGMRRARLTQLGPVTRVDIENTMRMDHPGTHGYVYFPTVRRWAPWESHPFSVIPTQMLHRHNSNLAVVATTTATPGTCADCHGVGESSSSGSSMHLTPSHEKTLDNNPTPILKNRHALTIERGITFYIKSHSGLTRALHSLASTSSLIPAFVEGPYGHQSQLTCDRLVCLTGGVGITATLPYFATHHSSKLYWSVKAPMQALVDDITSSALFNKESPVKEREVRVGGRFDMREVLEIEAGNTRGVLGVVVCGPAGMCDDVRKVVVDLGKKGRKVEMRVEAFSW